MAAAIAHAAAGSLAPGLASDGSLLAETLEMPDYGKFTRRGETGRLIETKAKNLPKIFMPYIIRLGVHLGPARMKKPLTEEELLGIVTAPREPSDWFRSTSGILADEVIDVIIDSTGRYSSEGSALGKAPDQHVIVTLRGPPSKASVKVGEVIALPDDAATVNVLYIEDTVKDQDESRRGSLQKMVMDPTVDGIVVSLPQLWIIPDPQFTPKSSSLPLYPGSYWLRFLGLFGSVQSSTLLFTEPQSEAMGLTAICVKFRDHKAIRQALLVLYNRYLLHPKKADEGMKLSWIRPVNYARVLRESSAAAGHGEATTGDGKGTPEEDPLPMPMPPPLPVMPLPPSGSPAGGLNTPYIANPQDGVLRTAIQLSCPEGGTDVPSSVAEAFKQLLERLAALEKENNHMAQVGTVETLLSVTQTSTASAADGKKEVKPLPLDSAGGYDPEAAEQMDSEDEEEAALERLGLTSSPPPPSTSSQGSQAVKASDVFQARLWWTWKSPVPSGRHGVLVGPSAVLPGVCATLPSGVAAAAAAAITMAKRRVVGLQPRLLDRALTSAGLTCRSTLLLVYSAVNSGLPDSVLSEIITNSRARLAEDPDVVGLIELAYLIRRCSGPHYPDILQVLIERLSTTEKSISWESLPSSSIAMSLVVLSDIPKTVTEQWREDCERQLIAAPVSGDVVRILARECGDGGRLPNAAVLRAVVSSQAARAEPPETLLASLAWETSRLLADRIDQLRAMDIFALSCTLLAPPARGPVGEILALDETLLHAMGEAVAVARHRLSAVNLETVRHVCLDGWEYDDWRWCGRDFRDETRGGSEVGYWGTGKDAQSLAGRGWRSIVHGVTFPTVTMRVRAATVITVFYGIILGDSARPRPGRFRKSLNKLARALRLGGSKVICDATVVQHHGYLPGRGDNELFYWFFESRTNPRGSPTVVYFEGGPGGSSLYSAISGNGGPCVVDDSGTSTLRNEYSWNTHANVMYLDQPAGSRLQYLALTKFFAVRPEYNTRVFLAGQSYAGHYIPPLAAKLRGSPVRLEGIILGNANVMPEMQWRSYPEMLMENGLISREE
ncbi:26S protease regulatory subunit 7 [Perkinsus olseni]|uniref:26S protease regulatory subunit 7 n=1 Tax=Perkinsus olseni TaxID=32597 RepID=A0A7J6PC56_PEROL|nr:26S protease regulatory subunit 7 [Perkinsus olseni]